MFFVKKYLVVFLLVSLMGVFVTAQEDSFVFGDALPDAPELSARGDYNVGVRTISVTNPDQADLLAIGAGDTTATYDRTLTLEVWYPANLAEGEVELVTYDENLGRADVEGSLQPFTFLGRAARDAQANMDAQGKKIEENLYQDPDFAKTYKADKKYAQDNGQDFIEMKDREIVALIAYLQRLGTDIKVKDVQKQLSR